MEHNYHCQHIIIKKRFWHKTKLILPYGEHELPHSWFIHSYFFGNPTHGLVSNQHLFHKSCPCKIFYSINSTHKSRPDTYVQQWVHPLANLSANSLLAQRVPSFLLGLFMPTTMLIMRVSSSGPCCLSPLHLWRWMDVSDHPCNIW